MMKWGKRETNEDKKVTINNDTNIVIIIIRKINNMVGLQFYAIN